MRINPVRGAPFADSRFQLLTCFTDPDAISRSSSIIPSCVSAWPISEAAADWRSFLEHPWHVRHGQLDDRVGSRRSSRCFAPLATRTSGPTLPTPCSQRRICLPTQSPALRRTRPRPHALRLRLLRRRERHTRRTKPLDPSACCPRRRPLLGDRPHKPGCVPGPPIAASNGSGRGGRNPGAPRVRIESKHEPTPSPRNEGEAVFKVMTWNVENLFRPGNRRRPRRPSISRNCRTGRDDQRASA